MLWLLVDLADYLLFTIYCLAEDGDEYVISLPHLEVNGESVETVRWACYKSTGYTVEPGFVRHDGTVLPKTIENLGTLSLIIGGETKYTFRIEMWRESPGYRLVQITGAPVSDREMTDLLIKVQEVLVTQLRSHLFAKEGVEQ